MAKQKGIGGTAQFWHDARNPPKDPTTSFAGKTILITGANAGIGFEAALKFAALGAATLIFGVRNVEKGNAAKERIVSQTSYDASSIHVYTIDCSSFASVSAFASNIIADFPRLDIAVLNAGIASPSYSKTPDGWESTLQINALASMHLALLLLPKLRESAVASKSTAVLEFVGSEAYLDVERSWIQGEPQENILQRCTDRKNFVMAKQYHVSKILQKFAMEGIVRDMKPPAGSAEGGDVVVLMTSPSMTKTELGREFGAMMKAMMRAYHFFVARTAEEGSRSLVSGAALGPEWHGTMWINDKADEREPVMAKDDWNRLSVQAWSEMLEVLEKVQPGIRDKLTA